MLTPECCFSLSLVSAIVLVDSDLPHLIEVRSIKTLLASCKINPLNTSHVTKLFLNPDSKVALSIAYLSSKIHL